MKKTGFAAAGTFTMLAALAFPAHALIFTVTEGSFSSQAGASTVTFGVSPINNSAPLSGGLPSGVIGGVTYSYSGGALFNFDSSSSLPNGTSARPVGSEGNFWSIGTNPAAQQGPGVISLGAGVSYFGFLWGSPDGSGWNSLSFYNGTTQLGATLNGISILNPPDGNQAYSRYFNVYAEAGEVITEIRFNANQNAFETDNHAFISAVPEPETYAMMLAGLGMLGFMRRRQQAKAKTV